MSKLSSHWALLDVLEMHRSVEVAKLRRVDWVIVADGGGGRECDSYHCSRIVYTHCQGVCQV